MYILFDIGGTKTRFAVSRDGETFEEPVIIHTPLQFEDAITTYKKIVHKLANHEPIVAIGGGIRGPLSEDKSTLLSEIVLTDWVGKPIRDALSTACEAPVFLQNDTAVVGLGEAVAGAGKEYDIVAYVTVSTGVGGVKIESNVIDESAIGFEPGKMIIDPDNTLCPECPGNTLEDYVSGSAVEKRFGKKPYEILDTDVWREIAQYLAIGIHNVVVTWSPHAVVLGGSMIVKEPGIDVLDVENHFKELLTVFPDAPVIKKAELGDVGGLHGALAFLKQQTH